ncbi:MAG: hypothetical protein Q7J57_11425, partial [Gemmobacter sp.]|nr:hypothetical protein [Gemmobacter sp.]
RPGTPPASPPTAEQMRSDAIQRAWFTDVRNRYLRWRDINAALTFLNEWKGAPLYPPPASAHDLRHQQQLVTDAAFLALHAILNPTRQDPGAQDHGCFEDIPLPPSEFTRHIHAALRIALARQPTAPLRFLDVGCGGGIKVLQAAQCFALADGLEYDPGYVEVARSMLSSLLQDRAQVFHADALTFDRYGDYDVIYFYRPMRDPDLLIQLEDRILAHARPGTLLIAPYASFGRRPGLPCEHMEGSVHIAGLDSAGAADLYRRSCQIALTTRQIQYRAHPRNGYLAPLIEVILRNGYPFPQI